MASVAGEWAVDVSDGGPARSADATLVAMATSIMTAVIGSGRSTARA